MTMGGGHAGKRALVLRRTAIAVGVGVGVTILILATPYVAFGVHSPTGHLVLNTLDAFIALLVAFLVHGRFLRRHRLQDLLLSQGLAFLAVAGLGLSQLSHFMPDVRSGTVDVWLPLSIRVLGAALIAAAALVGDRSLSPGRRQHWPVAAVVLTVAVVSIIVWASRSLLPVALDLGGLTVDGQQPLLTGHPVLLLAQLGAALCFGLAAALFTIQATRSQDELLRWLGPAFVLGAFARLNYVLFPSIYTDWLYTGDLLRTGCYVLLLVGATREIQQFWHAQSDVAVLEDRRRLARELHDGVIQELSYIKSASYALPAAVGTRESILGACDRALDEARAAVHALGSASDEPLSDTLRRAVRQLAERYDVEVAFDLAESVSVTPDQRHALVRIAREAVNNAVRHGKAGCIRVTLDASGQGRCLSVLDDGAGFEVADGRSGSAPRATGYGLTSMKDRVRGLPGELTIESTPGHGSVVHVQW